LRGPETLDEVLLHSPEGFGQVLYGQLTHLLRRCEVPVDAIDCFAAASGPGSFTGVRIGLVCVKGLAEALGRPVAAVSNLQAMAAFGSAPLRAPVLDARRGEVYGAVYDDRGGLVIDEIVAKFPDWLSSLPAGELEFVATDFAPFLPALVGTRFSQTHVVTAPRALAAAIGRIAFARLEAGQVTGAASIDANYVRRSDAELLWKDR